MKGFLFSLVPPQLVFRNFYCQETHTVFRLDYWQHPARMLSHPILLLVFINCNFADDSDLTAGYVSTKCIYLFEYFMGPFHGYDSVVSRQQTQSEETIYLSAKLSGVFWQPFDRSGKDKSLSRTLNHYMFYVLDILDCAVICSISHALRENPK